MQGGAEEAMVEAVVGVRDRETWMVEVKEEEVRRRRCAKYL